MLRTQPAMVVLEKMGPAPSQGLPSLSTKGLPGRKEQSSANVRVGAKPLFSGPPLPHTASGSSQVPRLAKPEWTEAQELTQGNSKYAGRACAQGCPGHGCRATGSGHPAGATGTWTGQGVLPMHFRHLSCDERTSSFQPRAQPTLRPAPR